MSDAQGQRPVADVSVGQESFLRRHVARPVPGAALDTERICRAWARGRALARLPREVKPRWPARLTLVLMPARDGKPTAARKELSDLAVT